MAHTGVHRSVWNSVLALAIFSAAGVFSALSYGQEHPSATAEAAVRISLTIKRMVKVSMLDDVQLGPNGAKDRVWADDAICVWSSSRAYSVTAISQHGSHDAFHLISASGELIPYEVEWAEQGYALEGAKLAPGRPLTAQGTSAQTHDCSRGPRATAGLFMRVRASSFARQGSYSDALTLIVAPL